MDLSLVSVIVPVWNDERHIEGCLKSILMQDYPAMEIIVVNDGSTDRTPDILDKIARTDARIIVINKQNEGVALARNAALDIATGAYIRFVDSDDRLPPHALWHMVERMQTQRADLVIAAYDQVMGSMSMKSVLGLKDACVPLPRLLHEMTRYSNSFYYGVLWNKLFRADVIRERGLRFQDGFPWGEDFDFVCAYLPHTERIAFSTTSVYTYYRNIHGLTFRLIGNYLRHPIVHTGIKHRLYKSYKTLYQTTGLYKKYRHVLWLYMIRTTITN